VSGRTRTRVAAQRAPRERRGPGEGGFRCGARRSALSRPCGTSCRGCRTTRTSGEEGELEGRYQRTAVGPESVRGRTISGCQLPPMKSGRRRASWRSSDGKVTATPVFWKSTASEARCALRHGRGGSDGDSLDGRPSAAGAYSWMHSSQRGPFWSAIAMCAVEICPTTSDCDRRATGRISQRLSPDDSTRAGAARTLK